MTRNTRFTILISLILFVLIVAFFRGKGPVVTSPVSRIVQVVAVSPADKFEKGILSVNKSGISGSGFIVQKEGLIVTSKHLVANNAELTVFLSNGEKYKATLVQEHSTLDVAILKIDDVTETLPVSKLKDSESLKVGDSVTAVSFEKESEGFLTSKNAEAEVESEGGITKVSGLLETTAKTEAGFSGGPLLNRQGEVIGINIAFSSDAQKKSVAIPMNSVIDFITKVSLND